MIFAAALSALLLGAPSTPSGTEVTIYNQGFGLIKENRFFDLKAGRQTVAVQDVASQIEADSVGFHSLSDPKGLEVLEQNYQFDLISPIEILNKSVGKRIRIARYVGDKVFTSEGVLLSSPTAMVSQGGGGSSFQYNGMVVRTDDGQILLDPVGEVSVTEVPNGLISVPTLLWDVDSSKAGRNEVELSYITQGISWQSAYVLTLQGSNGLADLQGWVTVNNHSGATYDNAKLKLLAGDVNRANRGATVFDGRPMGMAGAMAKADTFQEQALFEYHLYTLQRPSTIRNKEIKQLSLLEGHDVKVTKRLTFDWLSGYNDYFPTEGEVGSGTLSPQVRVEFVNSKENGLGMPLPMGTFKLYQRDSSGSVQMLGEDSIRHTPRNEKVSLLVGKSFDIVGSRKRMSFQRLGPSAFRESFSIELRNRKDTPDTVQLLERHWGDWKVTDSSDKYVKADAITMDFQIPLKANEVRTVKYTVETRW